MDSGKQRAPRSSRRSSSRVVVGRTIGEVRERLETANERAAARKKDKRKNLARIAAVSFGFFVLVVILIILAINFISGQREDQPTEPEASVVISAAPTIEIIDEASSTTGGKIPTRMSEYIALAEADFKNLDLTPTKAVLPSGSIRTIYLYLDGHSGFVKLTTDRNSAVSAEDTSRMLRYLASQSITDFEYIDVRTPGKAFWK